ncbi:cytochrome b5 domain-containing protein [Streptomyces sp. NPDC053048]|uniref:cytochrome b5 domain-containing protein n=1 Tax=Streptomyces sp. NPDC053048 TaxID=3365694 RepID=UPI0037D1C3B6
MVTRTSLDAIVREAEYTNRKLGHENLGSLSAARGFIPALTPELAFPSSHRLWDEVAAELPRLYADLRLRARLEELPVLDASPAALDDRWLQRAATVLGILVHAYHRVEPRFETPTPASVHEPWLQVCARLGRKTPFLSYMDLIVYNWKWNEPGEPADSVRVENVRLLVPTVGTEEEQNFYLTQLEMLDRGTPLVAAAGRAQTAVEHDDAPALTEHLRAMSECVTEITRAGLPKIDPRVRGRFHVDPVVWAKTVAPLAVPLVKHGIGPSGTASPMFHLMDSVIGRSSYRAFIGEEAQRLRENYPAHWRTFVGAARAAEISEYAQGSAHPPLRAAFEELKSVYAGENGLLGRHRLKVAGYLNTSFRVGRDVTISGFPRASRVGNELDASRAEREAGGDPGPVGPEPAGAGAEITVSELLRHDRAAQARWIGIGGAVYDVTKYLGRHPGGVAPLAGYLGTDATWAFEHMGHHKDAGIAARLRRMRVGALRRPSSAVTGDGALAGAYEVWLRWATDLTERANVLQTDLSVREARTSLVTAAGELTPYTLQWAVEAHERFVERTVADILRPMADELTEAARGLFPAGAPDVADAGATGGADSAAVLYAALEQAAAGKEDDPTLAEVDALWRRVSVLDQEFLHGTRSVLVDGVAALEDAAPDAAPELGRRLLTAVGRVLAGAAAYRGALDAVVAP